METRKEQAALDVADGMLDDEEIASKANITRVTLWAWKKQPAFAALVEETQQAFRAKVMSEGIADKVQRIKRVNRDWKKLQKIIDARAEKAHDFAEENGNEEYPGTTTGLIVKDLKMVGKGESAQLIEVFSTDTATLSQLMAHEKQAAQELGQWVEKAETTLTGDVVVKSVGGAASMNDL